MTWRLPRPSKLSHPPALRTGWQNWSFSSLTDTPPTYTPPGQGGPLDQFKPNGIVVNTFGIGSYVDANILTQIAQATDGTYTAIPDFADIPKVLSSLPGLVGLSSVKIDTNNDGIGDIDAAVGIDGKLDRYRAYSPGAQQTYSHRHRH